MPCSRLHSLGYVNTTEEFRLISKPAGAETLSGAGKIESPVELLIAGLIRKAKSFEREGNVESRKNGKLFREEAAAKADGV